MKLSISRAGRATFPILAALAVTALMNLPLASSCPGQIIAEAVGGVSIDAEGVLANAEVEAVRMLRNDLLENVRQAEDALNESTELRMISLSGLQAAIGDAQENNLGALPEEILYLCGLQRIQYVFVYPEKNDIVLAGPGEGWKVDERGNIVGITTGRPVIRLDDLLIALRSVDAARLGGISCSIEPTADGRRNLQEYLAAQTQFHPGVQRGVEQALGPQQILINGVPADSHFARVLVAADFKMKQLAMNPGASPIAELSSYMEMIRRPSGNMMPRWWMACNYDALARTEDGLGWELLGPGVKTMTENDFIAEDGSVQVTGEVDAIAQRWADRMTENYDELCRHEAVFGELRNLMDLCVIAAIIEREGLLEKARCDLTLLDSEGELTPRKWNAPRSVATYCSFVKKGRDFVISASGGVDVNSWGAAANNEVSEATEGLRLLAAPAENSHWWWNASS